MISMFVEEFYNVFFLKSNPWFQLFGRSFHLIINANTTIIWCLTTQWCQRVSAFRSGSSRVVTWAARSSSLWWKQMMESFFAEDKSPWKKDDCKIRQMPRRLAMKHTTRGQNLSTQASKMALWIGVRQKRCQNHPWHLGKSIGAIYEKLSLRKFIHASIDWLIDSFAFILF